MILSIIVPLYNSAPYIDKCVKSLLEQDMSATDYEIILVNDGSPDNCLEIAEQYATQHSNIQVLSQENKGPSAARNAGIRAARGKYLYFVDPDDYVLPNSFRRIAEQMEDKDLDMLRFRYISVDENYIPFAKQNTQPINEEWGIMTGRDYLCKYMDSSCFIWTWWFRTDIIKKNQLFCSEGVFLDDTNWLPKVLLHSERVSTVDVCRHFYMVRSNSLINNRENKHIDSKLKGLTQMLEILYKDKQNIADKDVILWYERMSVNLAIAYITTIATTQVTDYKQQIKRVKPYECYKVNQPLQRYSLKTNAKLKVLLMKISPFLLYHFIHLRH